MGSGSVSATALSSPAAALWILDPFYGTTRPATRETFVSWPPPGFVPYPVVFARWSFSYPNADFTSANVTMTSNGVPLTVLQEAVATGSGDNTLVWVPAGLDANNLPFFSPPATDTVYQVMLSNVMISGTPQSFAYNVTVFDPALPGSDFHPPLVTGPAQPLVGASNVYAFTAVSNAGSYEWEAIRAATLTFTDGAEAGLANFIVQASTNLYEVRDPVVQLSGSYSFHFATAEPVSQILTLDRVLLAASNSTVQFQSQLGYATSDQVARVQVSTDEG